MLRRLSEDQETVVQTFKQAVKTAQEIDDISSEDLLTQRVRTHEKNAWMLRAHLE
jgi:starvation-inducible DNA-binding protein